ncbi:MAG: 4Fe-4S dicluster domain-containing protein [Acidobacteriota bacterium]
MALRKVVHIDEEKCDGCGDCVPSCAEGAIRVVDGKARLVADVLCDGLGACLGECPRGAITVEEREAEAFDEKAVAAHLGRRDPGPTAPPAAPLPLHPLPVHAGGGGCPGSRALSFGGPSPSAAEAPSGPAPSALRQWPVQLHLVSPGAPYFREADVLLAADCTAFAMGDFHSRWLAGKALAVACPKLDHGQEIYLKKLVSLIDEARINTLTVLVMEVPCCGGLLHLASEALRLARRKVPVKRVVVGLRGDILEQDWM